MTLVITKENAYFIVCVVLLILQVYQHTKILKLKKDLQNLTNHVMILFFSAKIKQDEEKQPEAKQTV